MSFPQLPFFIPIHIFDTGESLPKWEQGQDQDCKDDRPNEGGL